MVFLVRVVLWYSWYVLYRVFGADDYQLLPDLFISKSCHYCHVVDAWQYFVLPLKITPRQQVSRFWVSIQAVRKMGIMAKRSRKMYGGAVKKEFMAIEKRGPSAGFSYHLPWECTRMARSVQA